MLEKVGTGYVFENTIKEVLTHDQNCENQKCKENGLDKLKVVDVECVGLNQEAFFNDIWHIFHIWQ